MILEYFFESIFWVLGAIFISAFGNIVGIGGGVFMVPLLVVVGDVPIEQAIGIVAISLFISALTASIINSRNGLIDYKAGIVFEVPAVLGAIGGAYLTSVLPLLLLQYLFAVYLFWTSFRLFRKPKSDLIARTILALSKIGPMLTVKNDQNISLPTLGVFGVFAGGMGGLFGIGGGIIKTPIMIRVFNFPATVATSTSVFMIAITSFFSALTHYSLGHIDIARAAPIIFGFFVGAIFGTLLKGKIKSEAIVKLLAFAMALAGVSLIFNK